MNRKKRPALFLVLTALLVTVCRCQPDVFSDNSYHMIFGDGVQAGSCKLFTEYFESKDNSTGFGAKPVWECEVPCPDGSVSKFDLYQQPQTFLSAKSNEEKAAFQAQYCSPEAMIPAAQIQSAVVGEATATNTPTPTDTPTSAPDSGEASLLPYLVGGVNACDTGLQFINFPIDPSAPELAGRNLSVSLNGVPVKCEVASNNAGVLACTLLKDTVFPLTVSVKLDDVEVNHFTFDGAICTETVPSAEPSNDNTSGNSNDNVNTNDNSNTSPDPNSNSNGSP